MPKTTILRSRPPSLETAQSLVGGYVQLIELHDGSQMLVNEDGIMRKLPENPSASERAGMDIVGDVVVLVDKARWLNED
jgi:hypothetical protein